MMDRFDEAWSTVRGETRYFAIYATDYGVLHATCTRAEPDRRQPGAVDYSCGVSLFCPDLPDDHTYKWIASLLYRECEGVDVPMHGTLTDAHIESLRADCARVLERATAILAAYDAVGSPVGGRS